MSFQVTITPSGKSFSVKPDDTVLGSAIAQGVGLPYGCQDGACGTCKCKLTQGEVELDMNAAVALSQAERDAGLILTCCSVPRSDLVIECARVAAEGAYPVKRYPCRVSSIDHPSADVCRILLQLPASDKFMYHAGQYVDFLLKDGVRRSYSMANAPHTGNHLELHIRHMPGGKFTDYVFSALKEKEILRFEGPFGSFYLREDSTKPIVLLASGTGFAPIKALIEHAEFRGLQRPMTLYWGQRRPQDLYASEWIEQALTRLPQLRYVPVISDALPEDGWRGRSGLVHRAVLQDLPDLSGHQVYACGAPVMVNAALEDFTQQAGLPADEFYADSFVTEKDKHAKAALAG